MNDVLTISETDESLSLLDLIKQIESEHGTFDNITSTIVNDYEPVFKYVSVYSLFVDKKYQRYINKNFLKKVKSLDLSLLQPLVVFERPSGKKMINDGQHKAVISYFSQGKDYEVPCMIYTHKAHHDSKKCRAIEAEIFKKLNVTRKNVSQLDTVRAGLQYDEPSAIEFNNSFVSMGIKCQGIGDVDYGIEVRAFVKARVAFTRYGISPCKKAVDYLRNIYEKRLDKNYVDGSMIGGLSAIFNLISEIGPETNKGKGLILYLEEIFPITNIPSRWNANSAGNSDYIIIARRIVDEYNKAVEENRFNIKVSVIGKDTMKTHGLGPLEDIN